MEKICNFNEICVLRVAKGQRNELCFKAAYRSCECKCANVTSSRARLCLELFQNVQLKKKVYFDSLPIPSPPQKKYNVLLSSIKNKILSHHNSTD